MAAYDKLINLVQDYFVDMGFNPIFVEQFFSEDNFKEIVAIRLANANVMIKNKTDKTSHQTHISITGEAINFFYNDTEFADLDNEQIDKQNVYVIENNIWALNGKNPNILDVKAFAILKGHVTIGKRTQKQVQLSKKNTENSDFFNALRLGLYENDLLILLKYRSEDAMLAIGIPQTYYLDILPNYAHNYENNTYLRIPLRKQSSEL